MRETITPVQTHKMKAALDKIAPIHGFIRALSGTNVSHEKSLAMINLQNGVIYNAMEVRHPKDSLGVLNTGLVASESW